METKEEQLRQILHDLDWFKIMQKAVDSRKTSWNFEGYGHPIIEWRNATDEVCMAVINALEDKGILEDMYSKVEKIRRIDYFEEDGAYDYAEKKLLEKSEGED